MPKISELLEHIIFLNEVCEETEGTDLCETVPQEVCNKEGITCDECILSYAYRAEKGVLKELIDKAKTWELIDE